VIDRGPSRDFSEQTHSKFIRRRPGQAAGRSPLNTRRELRRVWEGRALRPSVCFRSERPAGAYSARGS
jgi:hypothetical protein